MSIIKFLLITSLAVMTLASCDSNTKNGMVNDNNPNTTADNTVNNMKNGASDIIDGAGDVTRDVTNGVGNAVKDTGNAINNGVNDMINK